MTEETKAKREQLKALSKLAAELVKMGEVDSINQGLQYIYAKNGHTELNSYRQWQSKGYQVRKGSKALLMWGQPVDRKKETKNGEAAPAEPSEDKADFWPLAYLFSNLHVEPLQQ